MNEYTRVKGVDLDEQSRCRHWHSPVDIIAIKFACCETYYACYSCHEELAGHETKRWPPSSFEEAKVILCGNCKQELTIAEYQSSGSECPSCGAGFNPRCSLHWPLYFIMESS